MLCFNGCAVPNFVSKSSTSFFLFNKSHESTRSKLNLIYRQLSYRNNTTKLNYVNLKIVKIKTRWSFQFYRKCRLLGLKLIKIHQMFKIPVKFECRMTLLVLRGTKTKWSLFEKTRTKTSFYLKSVSHDFISLSSNRLDIESLSRLENNTKVQYH